MDSELSELKPLIRSILLSLGRRATEVEFRRDYYNIEGESFDSILAKCRMTFFDFMRKIPDVCRVYNINGEIQVDRVSTEGTSHMNQLTIVKKRKGSVVPRFRQAFNSSYNFNARVRAFAPSISSLHKKVNFTRPTASSATFQSKSVITTKKDVTTAKPSYPWKSYQSFNPPLSSYPPAPHSRMKTIIYKPDVEQIEKSENVINPPKILKTNQPLSAPHSRMKTVIYKPDVEQIEKSEVVIIDLTVEENEMSNAKPKPKEIFIDLKNLQMAKKSEDDLIDLTSDTSNSWSTEDEAEVTVPPKTAVETNPFKINVLAPKTNSNNAFNSDFNHFAGRQEAKPVCKKKTEYKSEKENIPANNSQNPPAGSKVVLNPLSIRLNRHREYSLFNTAMGNVRKENKISLSDSNNYSAKVLNLDDYLTRPMSISYPIAVDSKRFFEVKLMEISSPSQFMFQFNSDQLQFMMDEMNIHYNNRNNNCMLKIPKVVKGMSVACPVDNLWYRAEVVKITDSDALVYFVDTGCTSYVNVTKLRYLENSFGALSRKCCKGSLFGVLPKNDALWQAGAIMDFMKRVDKSQVYATVRAVKDHIYELVLTSDLKDYTLISGFLVMSKYAECVAGLNHSINQVLI